ncbi:NACHT, LRR and PYD domains-containing protein 3-like isoform X1 [Nematostella vectensis]|uniref:NACHT, LRR and PYD domains-containing protein 3-like isoform X1 n=1 Tax=Nematostella vectensis TaxID=45351 RepID=UPI002077223B|nr:NACHT, LRR and PYD domains-containing protein 3-like isoform X1 [Nematostella vectensis]XP_048575795.1 NACHT, LRR and PYD domains-containing protein 3-like isoform X1 [Nematostella vectensis]
MASVLLGSEEKDNFQKLCRLLIDGGTQSLRTYFTSIHHPTPLAAFLNTHKKTLVNLKSRRILRQEQFDRLFPASGVPSANDYDITLLFLLLRHISGLSPPVSTSSWDVLPRPTDLTKEAHMARLKWYRNNVFAHIKSTEVPTVQFNQYWVEISDALISLGGVSQGEIDTLKVTPLEGDYVMLLNEWVNKDLNLSKEVNETKKEVQETKKDVQETKKEVQETKTKVDEIKKEVQETKTKVDETKKEVQETKKDVHEVKGKVSEMAVDLASLKEEFSSRKVNSKKDITAAKGDEAASGKTSHDPGNKRLPKKKVIQDFIDYLHLRYTTGEEVLIEPLEDMEDGNFTLENMFSELEIVRKDTDIKVPMYDVFTASEPSKKVRSVLLEGDSGAGKTTLCKKIAYDWATGVLAKTESFPQVELVLSLKCKGMSSKGFPQAVQDQLFPEEFSVQDRVEVVQYIKENQNKVLIILDGYDELPLEARESIHNVVCKKFYSSSYTLLTSRPEKKLSKYFTGSNALEIKGFLDVDDVISIFFNALPDYAAFIVEIISKGISNVELCNPLTLILFCLSFKDHCERNREKDFSHGMTLRELYEDVAYSQIRRYFEKENINFDDDDIQATSFQLGEIAFHSLKDNANTFPLPKLSEVLKKVGFLTRRKSPSTIRAVEMYSFVHKSFQDFFCAVFLADRLGQGIVESVLINDLEFYLTVNRYDLAMMVGRNVAKAVESLARKVPEYPPERIATFDMDANSIALKLLCQCLARCKQSEIVKVLEKAYCLLPCRVLLQIYFEPCYSTLLGLSYLLSYDLSRSQSLQTVGSVSGLRPLGDLTILFSHCTDGIPDQFTKALASSPIRKLGISCPPGAGDIIVKALVSMLSRTTLQSLILFDGIDEANFGNLIESLKNNVTLSEICIESDGFGDSCAIKLAEILSDNTSLTDVRIDSTILGGTGVTSLANALKVNKTVRTLEIRSHNMTSEAGRAIGEMLRHNTTVTSLFLCGGRLGDSGARGIAIGLAQKRTIAHLSLVRSSIGFAGIKAITKVIQNVTRLNLSGNPVGYGGVKAIARLLVKSCCRLKFLFLDNCNIDVFGAKELAIALSRNSCLEELSVACNDINDEGMCALAESVASNETLQVLYITYNNVGQNGKKVIISACETSKSVRHLYHENDSIFDTFTKPHSVCRVTRQLYKTYLLVLKFKRMHRLYKRYSQGVEQQVEMICNFLSIAELDFILPNA